MFMEENLEKYCAPAFSPISARIAYLNNPEQYFQDRNNHDRSGFSGIVGGLIPPGPDH